jgi:hypothetical protein
LRALAGCRQRFGAEADQAPLHDGGFFISERPGRDGSAAEAHALLFLV